ncbi:response regulator [Comamonas nitrativorans]|uniref:Response regulator n=1 Tax=Comamonas nitrativorans TaxID=108437 RepID=A0ABV9GSH4_9BURK
MKKFKVVIADDHPIVLMGVRELIEKDILFEVTEQAGTPSDLIKILNVSSPNIVITDFNMPDDHVYGDGIKLINYILRNYSSTDIIVLTMLTNSLIISSLYDLGVRGVVFKNGDLKELIVALNVVSQGGCYYPPNFSLKPMSLRNQEDVKKKISKISVKEFEILRHFVSGLSVGEIAVLLNRSIKTVSAQKISAMRKLELESDQDLLKFCIAKNIFDN